MLELGDFVVLENGHRGEVTVISRRDETCIVTINRTGMNVLDTGWIPMASCVKVD